MSLLPDAAFVGVSDAPSALALMRDTVGIGLILPRRGFDLSRGMIVVSDHPERARIRFYGTADGLRQVVEQTIVDLRALLSTASAR